MKNKKITDSYFFHSFCPEIFNTQKTLPLPHMTIGRGKNSFTKFVRVVIDYADTQ